MAALVALLLSGGCHIESAADGPGEEALAALRGARTPAELVRGEELFIARCSVCHGYLALGARQGPPLVHPVYAPSHHADAAFHLAVTRGVRAHHFRRYGNMPPVPGLAAEEIDAITAYVRWLQRTAGIE